MKIKGILDSIRGSKRSIKQAILKNDYDLFKEIINNSYCDINKLDEEYKTFLDYAVLSQNLDIMMFLIARKARLGTLFYLIQDEASFIESIELLHKAGYDLNSYDKLGFSAIHYASSLGFAEAIKYMMNVNVKISNTAFHGKTAMNLALNDLKVGVYIGEA